jgi:hypothetical protein
MKTAYKNNKNNKEYPGRIQRTGTASAWARMQWKQ